MGFFKKKKPNVVDWTEKLNKQQEKIENMRSDTNSGSTTSISNETSASPFPFFAGTNSTSSESSNSPYGSTYGSSSEDQGIEGKRRRLGKRLLDMTNKIEDLTNQIYKLQQRIEVLEKKLDVNRFD